MNKIDYGPPASWPPRGRQVYEDFVSQLQRRRTSPRMPLRYLQHFFRYQQQQELGYRDFPVWLWDDYRRTLTPHNQKCCWLALRSWLRFLYKRGELLCALHEELARPGRLPAPRRQTLSYEQVLQVLELPDLSQPVGLRDRALLEMAYSAALRQGELLALKLSHVDLVEGTVFVEFPKNGRDRMVPLGSWALHYLKRYLQEARPLLASPPSLSPSSSTALWLNRRGQPLKKELLSLVLRQNYRLPERVGFRLTLHQLRHCCANHMLERGAPVKLLQALLGHQTLESTQIYLAATVRQLQRVHRRHHPRNLELFWGPEGPPSWQT